MYRTLRVSIFRHTSLKTLTRPPKTVKTKLPSLKIKIRAGASKKLSSDLSKPSINQESEDNIEPYADNTQDELDGTQDELDGTQDELDGTQDELDSTQDSEQPNTNLKRRHDDEPSKDVESKAKKSKKEETSSNRPRGRPRKNPEVTSKDEKNDCEKEFSVVVYVEVAVPPKLHAGKTHKGDKMVPQAPQRCGPFSMFRRTKWTTFLENVAAVTDIDKENLLLPGMTWRMQGKREQDGLPLQSKEAFKAMRDILKSKARKEQPVLLVHHPLVPATLAGREKDTNNELETTRWSEKVIHIFDHKQ